MELRRLVKEGKLSLLEFCDWVGEGKFRRGEDIRRLAMVLKGKKISNDTHRSKTDPDARLSRKSFRATTVKGNIGSDLLINIHTPGNISMLPP